MAERKIWEVTAQSASINTMNEMKYKEYSAKVEEHYSVDKVFVGHIVGIRDIVGFHGSKVEELESAFHEAVKHYLEVCEKLGQEPQNLTRAS